MPVTADRLSQTPGGRNATPLAIMEAVGEVFGYFMDPCTDHVIAKLANQNSYFTMEEDGFVQGWEDTVFLNPPGKTVTGGTPQERFEWLSWEMKRASMTPSQFKKAKARAGYKKPLCVKCIKASHWIQLAWEKYQSGEVEELITLLYAAGSIGSIPKEMLENSILCFTCNGAESSEVNGSGRLAFETIGVKEQRIAQPNNTQSSVILYTGRDHMKKFPEVFGKFGAIKR